MADNSYSPYGQQPLGVGKLISDTFAVFLANFALIMGIVLLPTLFFVGLTLTGAAPSWLTQPGAFNEQINWGQTIIFAVVAIVIYYLLCGLAVMTAYHSRIGHPIKLSDYIIPSLAAIVPTLLWTLLVTIAAGLVIGLGTILLGFLGIFGAIVSFIAIVAGMLYLFACMSTMFQSALIERSGFSCMSRSLELSKDYRWPIAGFFAIFFLISLALSFVSFAIISTAGIDFLAAAANPNALAIPAWIQIVNAVIQSVGTALMLVSFAVLYVRLREIKEGTASQNIAKTFE